MRDDRELTPEQLAAFGAELDALRQRTLADLGADDARYIRRVRAAVRVCCWSGRALLMFGWLPPTWLLGSLLLGLGKILENMELGHNVMHGQYDWMNDPEFAGRAYEWDIAGPSDFWRHTHNHIHHTYTNVLGKDDDVGYGVVRLFPEQRWKPFYRWQPLWVTLQALLFQYAVAIQHLRLDKYAKGAWTRPNSCRCYAACVPSWVASGPRTTCCSRFSACSPAASARCSSVTCWPTCCATCGPSR